LVPREERGGRSIYEPGGSNQNRVQYMILLVGLVIKKKDYTVDCGKANQAHIHWDKSRIVPKEKVGA
jgi:hypothetical protein